MPAPTLNVVADTPEFDHGEIDDKPVPAPKAIKRRVSAAAATAPAATAAHETAESRAPPSSSATMAISVARKSLMARPLDCTEAYASGLEVIPVRNFSSARAASLLLSRRSVLFRIAASRKRPNSPATCCG